MGTKTIKARVLLFCGVLLLCLNPLFSQSDSLGFWQSAPEPIAKRIKLLGYGEGLGLTLAYVGLGELWYSEQSRSNFQLFNDNDGWLQMDKVGHTMSAYYLGYLNAELFIWAGLPRKQAYWIGGGSSLLFLTGIEIFDGFSERYGFSTGDMIANTAGSALLIGQEYLWGKQHVVMKFSFSQSPYTNRSLVAGPGTFYQTNDLLGNGLVEEILKDYNGQTYWLSANVNGITGWDAWPAWLNMAVGYGGDGMLHPDYRDPLNGEIKPIYLPPNPGVTYQRQFYISPDIDFRKIPTKNKALKAVFKALNFIKFPMPTYEINSKGNNQFYWLFF